MKPSIRQGGATRTKTRIEQAEARTEQAEKRTEQARTRAEQAGMTLQRVVRRGTVLPQEISPRLLKKHPANGTADQKSPREELTERQRRILELIAGGNTNKEMAYELGISTRTVEGHRENLMTRLNIHDTAGLTRYAIRAGIIAK